MDKKVDVAIARFYVNVMKADTLQSATGLYCSLTDVCNNQTQRIHEPRTWFV